VATPLLRAGAASHEQVPRSSGPVARGGGLQRVAQRGLGLGRRAELQPLTLALCAGGRRTAEAWTGPGGVQLGIIRGLATLPLGPASGLRAFQEYRSLIFLGRMKKIIFNNF
jgi:hypothetical protein